MRRCALPPPLSREQITLGAEAKRYLSASLRLKVGDRFIGFDGESFERVFELQSNENELIAVGVGDIYQGLKGAPVGLCFAMPKGDKLDLVARQITELGVSTLHLWSADRSIGTWKRAKVESKLARLNRVISEAARQSGRADLLKVTPPCALRDLVVQLESVPHRLFLDPKSDEGWPLSQASNMPSVMDGDLDQVDRNSHLHCVVLVGPEGGLSSAEISLLKESGWRGVALSSPILRTETAGVIACAIALDRLGYLA